MTRKEAVIQEYFNGFISFRELSKKYSIGTTTIHRWVRSFEGRFKPYMHGSKSVISSDMKKQKKEEKTPEDIESLKKELAQERLRNKLLTAMIEVAEEQLKISIRKKYGTKRLKK